MEKIVIINTGGTFNKRYDPLNGSLYIDTSSKALETIASKWLCQFEIINIIGKDSLEITNRDRLELLAKIIELEYDHIIIVHGTDTMHLTAEYLADGELEKTIVLTGAMVPYSIDPIEATANLSSAYGYLNALNKEGVYIAMNGVMGHYQQVLKERSQGKFILS
ncbi:MAG: asparaginase domain-containing protein [Campylobacterota bacterium]|nr:asparaginase domain-containing protein [Campylobacterota bacterium]